MNKFFLKLQNYNLKTFKFAFQPHNFCIKDSNLKIFTFRILISKASCSIDVTDKPTPDRKTAPNIASEQNISNSSKHRRKFFLLGSYFRLLALSFDSSLPRFSISSFTLLFSPDVNDADGCRMSSPCEKTSRREDLLPPMIVSG